MTQPTIAGAKAPAETSRSGFQWIGIFGPLIGLALAVVFLSNTSWYLVFESIHVLAAVIWLGGGAAITLLAWRAQRARDNAELLQVAKQAEWMSLRVFVPMSVVVVAGASVASETLPAADRLQDRATDHIGLDSD